MRADALNRTPTDGTTAMTSTLPEDVFAKDVEPFSLELICRSCKRKSKESFKWALIDPDMVTSAQSDRVLLSRIVTCKRCAAVDAYDIDMRSLLGLTNRALVQEDQKGAVRFGHSRLWDGSVMRRPSQGVAHLQRLCAELPHEAEPQRRLGNVCDRFELHDQALAGWTRAAELDADEFEATQSLAAWYWYHTDDTDQAVRYLARAVPAYVKRCKGDGSIHRFAPGLAEILLDIGHCAADEFNLMAMWSEGEFRGSVVVNHSVACLRLVDDPEPLVAFLQRDDIIAIALSGEPVTDQPTRLQLLLAGVTPPPARLTPAHRIPRRAPASRATPFRPAPTPNRNAPCTCNSGKMYKHCCGR